MGKPTLTGPEIEKIINLRKTGHSIPEIVRITRHGRATVFKYVQNIQPPPEFIEILRAKQGGSKERARRAWEDAASQAKTILYPFTQKDPLCIIIGLYWGEGTKKELNLINSDPRMIKMFIEGVKLLGVRAEDLRLSLRLFEGTSSEAAIAYWASALVLPASHVHTVHYIQKGTKQGRHPYGMCRVRVARSAKYFKLLMSLIRFAAEETSPRSSMDRTAHS